MHGNHDGSWFRPAAGDGGSGSHSRGGFRPQAHPLVSNFNVRQPNIYPLPQYPVNFHLLNPSGLPSFSIGNPNFPVQQNLNFPPLRPTPSFHPHQYSGVGNVLPQTHGQSFSRTPQLLSDGISNDDSGGGSEIRGGSEVLEKCSSKPKRKVGVKRIDMAVDEARKAMIAAGECVSSSRVSESVLSVFKADSWRSLGVQMLDVPSLRRLMAVEGKINAFIHCFVGVRRVVTLYDLEVAICKNEVVDCFDDLEMGPLLRHPLVLLYFPSISGATGPCQITSEEIISFLDGFLDTYKKNDVKLDDFLNFVAKKKSVASKEELGVRIQSLGMHVSFIRHAKRQEGEMLRIFWTELQQKYNVCSSKKQQLDDHSRTLSDRIESFSFVHKDFRGNHIRFDSSSSDDEYSGNFAYEVNDISSSDHVSSCPYPSAAEEMKRLGFSKKKRKAKSISPGKSEASKLRRTDCRKQDMPKSNDDCDTMEVSYVNEGDYTLSDEDLKLFISTWKDTCKELNTAVVLEKMFKFYKSVGHEVHARRRARLLSSFPFIGLLNVAVTSMRCGMWDTIYDNLQKIGQDDMTNAGPEFEIIDVKPIQKYESLDNRHAVPRRPSVRVEEIIKRLPLCFEYETSGEKHIGFLRRLHNCGVLLAEQFQVQDFESLGCGAFFAFLEKHLSLLPAQLQKFLSREIREEYPLEVCMHENFLAILLSEASEFLADSKMSKPMFSALLRRQFPSINLKIVENGSTENFTEIVGSYKNNVTSKSVVFSATVLGVENSLSCGGKYLEESSTEGNATEPRTRTMSSIAPKDAFDVLRKAPLLSDLNSWCHWDLVFAPSLGPLVGWLFNEINSKELLCLVTKDGKVIRIDPSATGDSFLEAALQGSAYHTAVQLLSLISLNGRQHLPLSLLKCYAQRAFEVILNNHLEKVDLDDNRKSFLHVHGPSKLSSASTDLIGEVKKTKIDNTQNVASRFLLDCLGYLPAEFRGLAADILLFGLRSVVKSAPVTVLSACKETEERIMLHDVGLFLGIVEWVNDYHFFCSSCSSNFGRIETAPSNSDSCTSSVRKESGKLSHSEQQSMVLSEELCEYNEESRKTCHSIGSAEVRDDSARESIIMTASEFNEDPRSVIDSIRQDEFGLDSSPSAAENSMLHKQHARLGRALQCLSQELYSQDSHFILELVQNADDNTYAEHVEPTLTFILQETGIVVLNNEHGFSPENIRALCDVGRSTKKGSGGYIGKKGIGFKSVFRVSDAPEIHSNGFHFKFDISEGQIGFVLPTAVPPYDIDSFSRMLTSHALQLKDARWNTCIALPFRSIITERTSVNHIKAMFSDLHPSLLLFLHRLQCIVYRNMLEDSLLVMRKEILGENIIKVSCGENNMTWFVASEKLHAASIRDDVQTTEIAVAFALDEPEDGTYRSHVIQQPVFAFLPLRTYGLKFILQGDFILTSSREEVDEDSPWNQWLLSEFPGLFVGALRSFCTLPSFRENLGKAVATYMQFVPLPGEVHGFFSCLPRTIISKLRTTNCLLLEGGDRQWVPPYKVLRGWNESARVLLAGGLLQEHLGLGFLEKDIVLSDSLSRALGIEDYGPKILVQILSSISSKKDGLRSMGLTWLSSFLIELYMLFHPSVRGTLEVGMDRNLVDGLRRIPFIPLSNGTFSSLDEGAIWLHHDTTAFDSGDGFEAFPMLYANLRTVDHSFLLASSGDGYCTVDNLVNMLCAIGVQKLSAHEIIKVHIIPAFGEKRSRDTADTLMVDYLCFVMAHLQSGCHVCHKYRKDIISELRNKALISTNYGLRRSTEVSIHFGEEFGNRVNVKRLTKNLDIFWHEVDSTYLSHPASKSYAFGLKKWREFFQEIGITDFVRVAEVEKSAAELYSISKGEKEGTNLVSPDLIVVDWESHELVHLLSLLRKSDDREGCKYLLEVLDMLWDDCYCDKTTVNCNSGLVGHTTSLKSSFMWIVCDTQWIVSSMDNGFYCPSDLFHDSDEVRLLLGTAAPYAVPKVTSTQLLHDIGLKTKVSLDDALNILEAWGQSGNPFKASISQMTRFYKFMWNEMGDSKQKITDRFRAVPSIFVPHETNTSQSDAVSGVFLSVEEVCWRDSAGILDQIKQINSQIGVVVESLYSKILCDIYPGLHDLFVIECGVPETLSFHDYLQILRQLAHDVSPSCAAKAVFKFFLKWSDDLKSGKFSEDILLLKDRLSQVEFAVIPTEQDKWVSLHSSFGLICWCDDKKLKKRFKRKDNIEFIYFGKLADEEQEMLQTKVSALMHCLGIPSISEVVTREAKYEGLQDSSELVSLVNWALPYAQRYIYTLHREKYLQMKKPVYHQVKRLRIFVVEKLCYRNVIQQYDIRSKKEFKCNCLLQDKALYATPDLDSHSLFMELSRLFFDGTPDLHLANFLHMIKTMAESGLNEEHMESFILNSQKVQRIPDDDRVWFLKSARKAKKKAGTSTNWPPASYKKGPGSSDACVNDVKQELSSDQPNSIKDDEKMDISEALEEQIPIEIMDVNLVAQYDDGSDTPLQIRPNQLHPTPRLNFSTSGISAIPLNSNHLHEGNSSGLSEFSERDQLHTSTPWAAQAQQTGRLGEAIAFRYFAEKHAVEALVKWVNEYNETGLPYDIVIEERGGKKQYIEVKATISARKDWFNLSVREWQFAYEKGDSYSIAHVLVGNANAILTQHRNPVKLCQEGRLRLVILMPKQQNEVLIVS